MFPVGDMDTDNDLVTISESVTEGVCCVRERDAVKVWVMCESVTAWVPLKRRPRRMVSVSVLVTSSESESVTEMYSVEEPLPLSDKDSSLVVDIVSVVVKSSDFDFEGIRLGVSTIEWERLIGPGEAETVSDMLTI